MPTLDLDFVRQQFPPFSTPSLDGWAFFNNAGGSYACKQVIDRLHTFYTEMKIQPYGPYPAGQRGGAAMDESYVAIAGCLNVTPEEVHFGPSTSQNTYVLANALRPAWKDGDEIIVSNQDHEANAGAWRRLEDRGIVVNEWPVDPTTGELSLDVLDRMLNERTRMVAFPQCSNVVAHNNPIAKIAAKAHEYDAIVIVDGVAGAPHGLPDLQELGCDIYLFSMYKTWGPHQGCMIIRSETMPKLANQSHYFNAGKNRSRMVPAGPDHAQVAAAAGVAHYYDALYAHHFNDEADAAERVRKMNALFHEHETKLLTRLLSWLDARDDLSIVGPSDPAERAPTVAVRLHNKNPKFVAAQMAEHKVMCDAGDFYGVRPLLGMNIDLDPGVLRLSFIHYTTMEEIEQLIAALDATL